MLIQFTVGNFRSFKGNVTLSMVASKLNARDPKINENNTIKINKDLSLLTSAAIYGANASGKSNLIRALSEMRIFVLNSSKESQANEPINTTPFLLNTSTEKKPSFFEVVFQINKTTYRYGFEANRKKVVSEWLFHSPLGKEAYLFKREEAVINTSREFKGIKGIKTLTRPNALFLSVSAQFNNQFSLKVLQWFKEIGLISGLDDTSYGGFTAGKFANEKIFHDGILEIIKGADVGIDDVLVDKRSKDDPNFFPKDMPQELKDFMLKSMKENSEAISFRTIHTKRDKSEASISSEIFDMNDESEGTQKLFLMSGPIVDTLSTGKLLVVDEIEARLHTLLTRKIIKLFNSKITNPKNAQVIFATHDTNLLSNKLFRRDQIWFVEKDQLGASHLYSLAEIKTPDNLRVRNDASFEDDYLDGKYGAIPMFGELSKIVLAPSDLG